MTDTTGRTIRIESALDTDRKTHALHHTKVTVDGVDITNDIMAIDWHADATSAPTATIRMYAPALQAEAAEAERQRADMNRVAGPPTQAQLDAFIEDTYRPVIRRWDCP